MLARSRPYAAMTAPWLGHFDHVPQDLIPDRVMSSMIHLGTFGSGLPSRLAETAIRIYLMMRRKIDRKA